MTRRDEFLESVKRLLRDRAGNQCSHPDCRAVTTGAAEHPEKVNNVGKAAHICAAAPGGPRYRPEMSKEERRSADNGIWLCSTHADEIDNDEERFPESLLRQWKRDAEESRKSGIGKPLPRPSDVHNAVAAALSGTSRDFVPSAIANVHKATEDVLGELDPRFRIETSYQNGATTFAYHAKEDVSFQMTVEAGHAREFAEQYRRMLTHGDDVTIDSSAIRFRGSKLLEELPAFFGEGHLNILSERKEAITRLRFVQKDSGIEEPLPDATGMIRHGTHALTFEGSIFGGMITLKYTAAFVGEANEGRITLTPTLGSWQGRPITRLPYLDSLHAFLDRLESGWVLEGTLLVEGLKLFSFDLNQLEEGEDGMAEYLRFVQAAGCVVEFLNVSISFDRDFLPTVAEFTQVIEAARIIRNQLTYSREEITGPIISPLIVDESASNVGLLSATTEPSVVKFIEDEGRQLTCMGEALRMPPRETVFLNILPRIIGNPSDAKPGDTVDVEWIPNDGFRMIVSYLQPAS
ncbi:MAG: hypothetical protein R3E46_10325 [Sedimenticolaceae bacterium]